MQSSSDNLKHQLRDQFQTIFDIGRFYVRICIILIFIVALAGIAYLIYIMNFESSFCKSFCSNFVEYSLLVRKMHENNEKQLTYGDFSNITDSLYKRAVVLQDNNLRLNPKSARHKKHWKTLSTAVDNFVRVLSLRKEFIEKLNIYYKKELSKDKQADLILNRLRDLEKKSLKIDSLFNFSFGIDQNLRRV